MVYGTIIAAAAGVLSTIVFLRALLSFTHNAREPPALATTIPFLEPVYGLLRSNSLYCVALSVLERSFLALAISPLPSLLSAKVFRARETLAAAMVEYLKNGGHEQASKLVRVRHDAHKSVYNFSREDIARAELGNMFAVLGNTTPVALWFIYHIFSDSQVLLDIRRELEANVEGDADTAFIDLACLRTSCPIFLSTFQEVLRFRALNAGPCMVLDDVVVDGFLFKKGSILMMPSCDKSPMATGFPILDHDIPVEFHLRHPEENWRVTLTGSHTAMGIVSEDVLDAAAHSSS
ncbi:hypothetical protein GGR57DRAFT_509429 [Xylariaceae sp. FL1272]|nr:hypothetical protein GGR57DRAFT_509429 [Xylariaceae sp. FL1272]